MSQNPDFEGAGGQEFMTVAEVAVLLRCHPRTVLNLIAAGKLRAYRLDGSRRWLIPTGEYYRFKAQLLDGALE